VNRGSPRRLTLRSHSRDEKLTLLYIDDSANDRHLVKEAIFLTETPFAFYEADGMESAFLYFQSRIHDGGLPRPAIVLLDYNLGNHTGTDLLHWLRTMKKITSLPVIMLSGSVGRPHVAECYATGANHFLSKPKNLERLKIIVRTLHLSLVSLRQPGPIQLLQEYRPDPGEHPLG
jgi:response regulator RpfG family c-di-GMP phosphodiesterase